jgi:hypothetical protein
MAAFERSPRIGVIHDTHPVEPTSGQVAEVLGQRPIPGIQLIQANVAAAAKNPPARFIDEELTSAFRPPDTAPCPLTYERARAQELQLIYGGLRAVIDIHNNATMLTTYGMIGPRTEPIALLMAKLLGITNIVVMEWPGYGYFDRNPNLLLVEGRDDNPDYSAEWWHKRLTRIAGASALSGAAADDFRFFGRLPDLTWTQARDGGFADLSWEAGFDEPLPEAITARLDVPDDTAVYALSWPNDSRVGYAPADSDYFGEVMVRIPPPPR